MVRIYVSTIDNTHKENMKCFTKSTWSKLGKCLLIYLLYNYQADITLVNLCGERGTGLGLKYHWIIVWLRTNYFVDFISS